MEEPVSTRRIRVALQRYWTAREELRALGVLRFDRSLHAEYAEWLAARMLGLKLATSGVQRGYDATDPNGGTYQIKARTVASLETSTSFDVKEPVAPFDFLLGFFLSPKSDLLGVIRVPQAAFLQHSRLNGGSRRLRWTRETIGAPWIEVLHRSDGAVPRASAGVMPTKGPSPAKARHLRLRRPGRARLGAPLRAEAAAGASRSGALRRRTRAG